jgi:hypothetical protein
MAKRKKYFANIVIQSKDDKEDFRAFLHCQDSTGQWWELRVGRTTPGEAADEAWEIWQGPEDTWKFHGVQTSPPNEK